MYNSGVAGASPDMLKKVPLFSGLDNRELEQIAASMRERRVSAGEVFLEQDYIGEIALLTGSDRTATATAKTDMLCYGMTPWDFKPLVESNSAIAWKLLTAMAQKLR